MFKKNYKKIIICILLGYREGKREKEREREEIFGIAKLRNAIMEEISSTQKCIADAFRVFSKHSGYVRDYIFRSFFPAVYDYMLSRMVSPGNFRAGSLGERRTSSGGSRSVLCAWREIAEASKARSYILSPSGAREIPRRGGHGARSSEAAQHNIKERGVPLERGLTFAFVVASLRPRRRTSAASWRCIEEKHGACVRSVAVCTGWAWWCTERGYRTALSLINLRLN